MKSNLLLKVSLATTALHTAFALQLESQMPPQSSIGAEGVLAESLNEGESGSGGTSCTSATLTVVRESQMGLAFPTGEGTHSFGVGQYAYTLNYLIDIDTMIGRAMNMESKWQTYVASQFDLWRYIWQYTDRSDAFGQLLATTFSGLGDYFYTSPTAMKDDLVLMHCGEIVDQICYINTITNTAQAFYSAAKNSGSSMIYWGTSSVNCPVKVAIQDLASANSLLHYFNESTGATVWGGSKAVSGAHATPIFQGRVKPGNDVAGWSDSIPIEYIVQ